MASLPWHLDRCWVMVFCMVGTSVLGAGDLPPLVLPEGVGVNIHFNRGHERDLDMIAAAGFKFIRMDLGWSGIERGKGVYDWSAYDELMGNLDKRGLRAMFILDYSNPLYEETVTSRNPITGQEHRDVASPQHPESVEAFARWAGTVAARYRGRRVIWEIWNEPNIHFWKPEPAVEQYNVLALATAKAVRAADPGATLVAPATSGFPWAFLEAFFKSGILEHLDAVSVHPYRNYQLSPETAAADYRRLREMIEAYAGGKHVAILSGEWGYATHRDGVSLETQAAYLVRQQLANVLEGVPLSIWYDWVNDGPDPGEREHNFGTVTPDLQPKPSYQALQTMTGQLARFQVVKRLQAGGEADYVLLLENGTGQERIAAWTMGEAHEVAVALDGIEAGMLPAVKGFGERTEVPIRAGKLRLNLEAMPLYVDIRKDASR